ncbi:MAG: ABC transporter ATP-binding protein, partial [Pseudomonadota bacterium]|nr:ABC transporter ATP-binding protein [Pseudomonadota bacterium]
MARIALSNLTRRFGEAVAVDGLDLEIADGEFVVLVGPSGCGKTTTLRMLAGLEPISAGRVEIDGADVTALPARERNLAMVFQSYALYPHMSVEENIGFALRLAGRSKSETAAAVAAAAGRLEIGHLLARRPRELSGGQRQRVAVARCIVREPHAFLFDEPLSNLDARLRGAARVEISRLQAQLGMTTLYVTHDQVEAMTMAHRIVLMEGGRIRQQGAPMELYERPADLFVAGFLGAPAMNLVPGVVEPGPGGPLFRAAGLAVPAPAGAPEGPATLGLRPEALAPGAPGPGEIGVRA